MLHGGGGACSEQSAGHKGEGEGGLGATYDLGAFAATLSCVVTSRKYMFRVSKSRPAFTSTPTLRVKGEVVRCRVNALPTLPTSSVMLMASPSSSFTSRFPMLKPMASSSYAVKAWQVARMRPPNWVPVVVLTNDSTLRTLTSLLRMAQMRRNSTTGWLL